VPLKQTGVPGCGKPSEQVLDGHRRRGVALSLGTQGGDGDARVEVELVKQESVGANRREPGHVRRRSPGPGRRSGGGLVQAGLLSFARHPVQRLAAFAVRIRSW